MHSQNTAQAGETVKHTPGPWHTDAKRYGVNGIPVTTAISPNGILKGRVIADVMDADNARLIAAAPEMLQALRAFAHDYAPRPDDLAGYRELARLAISKATGEL